LVVLDGIVTGPSVCALYWHLNVVAYIKFLVLCIWDCTAELANARGGVFCALHETHYGAKCQVVGCSNPKVAGIQACEQHWTDW
ncbi:hypothetical protein L208DRAFT_1169689, partial [Tricholoma matsutake]